MDMDVMSIAATSIDLSMYKASTQAGTSILKMAMDDSKENAAALTSMMDTTTQMMENSVQPYLGSNFDARI